MNIMNPIRLFFASLLFGLMTALILYPETIQAQYAPPTNVTLTMYQLDESLGGAKGNPPVTCTKDIKNIAESFGCTADKGNPTRAYPFNSSTITISIDGIDGIDNTQYAVPYLWDVVAREYGLNSSQGSKPAAGIQAQAIAARTYIYDRIQSGFPADNSASGYQAYLPYAYEAEGGDRLHQATMIAAMKDRYFMTPSADAPSTTHDESINPIAAFFGADNLVTTTHGTPEGFTLAATTNYLTSVDDPINAAYGCWLGDSNSDGVANHPDEFPNSNAHIACGTPFGGMSSKGASRWSFGHTSSRGPVPSSHPNYPHDDSSLGDFWSVSWQESFQILTHYYTGIHIRDANDNNTILTPAYRWNPLSIEWLGTGPSFVCEGDSTKIRVLIQNTGTEPWDLNGAFRFDYDLENVPGPSQSTVQAAFDDPVIEPGKTFTATLTIDASDIGAAGSVKLLVFDMYRGHGRSLQSRGQMSARGNRGVAIWAMLATQRSTALSKAREMP